MHPSPTMLESMPALAPHEPWISRHARRLGEIGMGHILYGTTGWVLDNIVYVWAICEFGLLKGGLLMGSLATIYSAVILVIYQRMGIDWVGAGSLDQLAAEDGTAWWQRTLRWASHKHGWVTFLALSVLQDAFITTAFYRKGKFGALEARDWKLFLGSALVSNFYWTLRSGAVGAVIVTAWRHFFT